MELVDTYKLLADESRLRLLAILSKGYFNVQELTSILNLGQSTVSHHLKLLSNAGITEKHREGTWTYYALNKEDSLVQQKIVANFLNVVTETNGSSNLGKIINTDNTAIEDLMSLRRSETKKFFESIAHNWEELRPEFSLEDTLIDLITNEIPDGSRLADLGCGSGAVLRRLLPRNGLTIGVDYSEAMLAKAKESLINTDSDLEFRLGYLEHLPIADESIDQALAYMVLHHVPAPIEALNEVNRILVKNGKILIVDLLPHNNDEMRERYGDRWLGFEPKEFHYWIEKCGFTCTNFEIFGENKEVFFLTAKKK
ncbi:MAG: metalloregulator ArsR/SmtB family transcription factor [Bdellovibrionales bacterium]|nr:metalloregulator ArsR/SmtB family transcription factor [Bdellovibrionales bacterium]